MEHPTKNEIPAAATLQAAEDDNQHTMAVLDREICSNDSRYKDLMGIEQWLSLNADIRRRFSKTLRGGDSVVYKGIVTETSLSKTGIILANMVRLIGAPLPLENKVFATSAVVSVTEDAIDDGQFWTRTYGRKSGFPQVIHSTKRFSGPTGLEEHIGYGINMALNVSSNSGAMVFESNSFCIKLGQLRITIPGLNKLLNVTVKHEDLGDGFFAFVLSVKNLWFGEMVYQRAIFTEAGCKGHHEKD